VRTRIGQHRAKGWGRVPEKSACYAQALRIVLIVLSSQSIRSKRNRTAESSSRVAKLAISKRDRRPRAGHAFGRERTSKPILPLLTALQQRQARSQRSGWALIIWWTDSMSEKRKNPAAVLLGRKGGKAAPVPPRPVLLRWREPPR